MLKQKPLNMNSKRSITLVANGLLELMKIKPFKEITISELTKYAGVVRATFYAHFETKEDVLSYHIYRLFTEKFQEHEEAFPNKELSLVMTYFIIWNEQTEFLRLLEKNKLLSLLSEFDGHLERFCYEDEWFKDTCTISSKAIPYSAAIYSTVLATILIRWIKTGMNETPEELVEIFNELVTLPV